MLRVADFLSVVVAAAAADDDWSVMKNDKLDFKQKGNLIYYKRGRIK